MPAPFAQHVGHSPKGLGVALLVEFTLEVGVTDKVQPVRAGEKGAAELTQVHVAVRSVTADTLLRATGSAASGGVAASESE